MQFPKESYPGKIREIDAGGKSIGGEAAFPFLDFDGKTSRPLLGLEVFITPPENELSIREWGPVSSDCAAWAKAAAEKADIICLVVKEGDDEGKVIAALKGVLSSVSVPVMVSFPETENSVSLMQACAKEASGMKRRIMIAMAKEENYKKVGALSLVYNHVIIAQTPMDVNLMKQLNILLSEMGVKKENIVMDPLSAGLGYGLEYTYSTIERLKIDALKGDDGVAQPIIAYASKAWDARETFDESKEVGDISRRGKDWEAATALSFLCAGANIIMIRNPEVLERVRCHLQ